MKVLCDVIAVDVTCFSGRAYFWAPELVGVVFFNGAEAEQGRYYDVIIEDADSYNLYGRTEDYAE